jgi:glyoxylase-like metal-dependent hydrolase (beta-lactamase superfamily II)
LGGTEEDSQEWLSYNELPDVILGRMPEPQKLIHEILPVGMLQCNCHIVGDPQTREAIVIDPGDDAAKILEIIQRHHLKVTAIIVTHTHIDHVIGLRRVREATGAPVYVHGDDLDLYRMLDVQASWLGIKTPEQVQIDQLVREGDVIRWGPYQVQILHTPGHTPGSICLYMPADVPGASSDDRPAKAVKHGTGNLFAGDTLFKGSIGRTDLWGGSYEGILRSLKGKLLELPDNTIVFPGHGDSTTIGKERETNPFLVGN